MTMEIVNTTSIHNTSSSSSSSPSKRSFEEMTDGSATTTTIDRTESPSPIPEQSNGTQPLLMHNLKSTLRGVEWAEYAYEFASKRIVGDGDSMREFTALMDRIISTRMSGTGATNPSASVAPILQPIITTSTPIVQAVNEVKPSPSTTATLPKLAPIFGAPSAASSTPLPVASTTTPAAASAASPVVAPTPPSDLILSIADVSLLTPKGKFTLQLTPSQLLLTNPGTPAKNLSVEWKDLEIVVDVPDMNKRDWLIVLQMKKKRGLLVGKKLHSAIVLKFLATEKVKEGRFTLHKSTGDASIVAEMQSIIGASGFIGSKLTTAVLNLLRAIPAVKQAPIVGHEPAIFDSLKKLPCVNCKSGVEDGSLYFLRTGLMFIKPVQYIPIGDIDGITPARGMSSTFDMKIGITGQKEEVAFIMIDPKEEGAITKYCQFLGKEQARLEKEAKQRKAGVHVAAPVASTYVSATPAATSTPPAAAASSSSSDAMDVDLVAGAAHGDIGISVSNIVNAPRNSRATRPKTFEGMESESEDEDENPSREKKGERNDGDESDTASTRSSDDSDFSDVSSDSSDDSAEYDSEKDQEEINSEDEREREAAKAKRRTQESSSDDGEDDIDDETEDGKSTKSSRSPSASSSSAAAVASSSSAANAIALDDDVEMGE